LRQILRSSFVTLRGYIAMRNNRTLSQNSTTNTSPHNPPPKT
jgi:hypothetical protein